MEGQEDNICHRVICERKICLAGGVFGLPGMKKKFKTPT